MKKIIHMVLVIAFITMAANETTTTLVSVGSQKPNNIKKVELIDDDASSDDTMATTTRLVKGPYNLTSSSGLPMYKGVQILSHPITGTSPTVDLAYQVTASSSVSDTVAVWTSVDTIVAAGVNTYVDFTSITGNYLWIRIHNYDDTESVLNGPINMLFKKDLTYSIKK